VNICIKTIAHKEQRYVTVGDWWWDKGGALQIRVSRMGNWKYEALVAVHELVEVLICRYEGISQSSVDRFDMRFESRRPKGSTEEPGDHPFAPYRREHCVATGVERILAALLGVNWKAYDQAVNRL
jgi:hypothetical protein